MQVEKFSKAILYCADCREVLPNLKEAVDGVVTDPPYGISYQTNWRKVLAKPDILQGDSEPPLWSVQLMYDAVKMGGALYVCTRFDMMSQWGQALIDAGAKLKTPIVWDKGNGTSGDLTGDYGNQCELILFAHKGQHKLKDGRPLNLWHVPREKAGIHPTPKPVALMAKCIHNSIDKGGIVLDPFMGCGSTGIAAIKENCQFIGIEIEQKYFDIACKKIAAEDRQITIWDFV